MNLRRWMSFGLDTQTREYLGEVAAHPMRSIYRLCRSLAGDSELEKRELLYNLALSLPDRVAAEYRRELEYLAKFPRDYTNMFPYARKEGARKEIEFGQEKGLPFVVHDGRKFFGPRDMTPTEMAAAYRYFTEEEGLLGNGCRECSPHAYTDGSFTVENGDTVVDVGCSDALFAFHHAERAEHIYLFESWSRWKPALEASFAPYRERTTILDRFVTDRTSGRNIRLADAVKGGDGARYFIKMDIEGGERSVIEASRDFLMSNRVKLSCCVYHRQDDAEVISGMLREMGFTTRYSNGYMLPLINGIQFPYFRRGVVYAEK